MLRRKLMGLGLCVYMVASTCVGVLAVTKFTGSSNCYNKSYSYSLTGNYNDEMTAISSNGSAAYTVMSNNGTAKRYMYAGVSCYNTYTSTTISSATTSGTVTGSSSISTDKITRAKGYSRYMYIHTGTVCGGATSSTPEVDYFKYEIYQTQ